MMSPVTLLQTEHQGEGQLAYTGRATATLCSDQSPCPARGPSIHPEPLSCPACPTAQEEQGSTLHWAGQVEVLLDQLHALSVHELERRQDLPQHPLAGAEGPQNLCKARAACKGHSTSG